MTLTCNLKVNDPAILGYFRITHGTNVELYNLQHHDNQNYSYIKPLEYSTIGIKFKAKGEVAKIEIWNSLNEKDFYLDNLRLVKLSTRVVFRKVCSYQRELGNNYETAECPVTSPVDYEDGEIFQCADYSLPTLNQDSALNFENEEVPYDLLKNWGVQVRHYFNKTIYTQYLNKTVSGGFLRALPACEEYPEICDTANAYFTDDKVLDCNALWGSSAFGRDWMTCADTQLNLVQNSGFENHACKTSNCIFNTFSSWKSSKEKFEVGNATFWPTSIKEGKWAMDLNPSGPTTISQTLSLFWGIYEFSFFFKRFGGFYSVLEDGKEYILEDVSFGDESNNPVWTLVSDSWQVLDIEKNKIATAYTISIGLNVNGTAGPIIDSVKVIRSSCAGN